MLKREVVGKMNISAYAGLGDMFENLASTMACCTAEYSGSGQGYRIVKCTIEDLPESAGYEAISAWRIRQGESAVIYVRDKDNMELVVRFANGFGLHVIGVQKGTDIILTGVVEYANNICYETPISVGELHFDNEGDIVYTMDAISRFSGDKGNIKYAGSSVKGRVLYQLSRMAGYIANLLP